MQNERVIVIRGGGDLATGCAHRLWSAGFFVLVLEEERPAAIRRQVSLCEAVYEGETVVEGMRGVRIKEISEAGRIWKQGAVPVLVDPEGTCLLAARPFALVDAILAKRNIGTHRGMAPLTIGLGPGFTAGEDVDVVIETMRGHNLGRIIRTGQAEKNTGIPGNVGGYTKERVLRAPCAGIFKAVRSIGDQVEKGAVIARIETGASSALKEEQTSTEIKAAIPGLIRGLLHDGYPVTEGFKVADIDPREEEFQNCFTISDKARCIAGSVLEVICARMLYPVSEKPEDLYEGLPFMQEENHVVSIVGAGGKTTLLYALAEICARRGLHTLIATTTHIYRPSRNFAGSMDAVKTLWREGHYAVIGTECENGKLTFPEEAFFLNAMKEAGIVLIEADGAKGFPCKVPRVHEPVLRPESDIVIGVMGLSACGKSMEEACFCLEEVKEFLGVHDGHILTEEDLAEILMSDRGTRKDVGERAYYVVLNQCDTGTAYLSGEQIRRKLRAGGIKYVLLTALKPGEDSSQMLVQPRRLAHSLGNKER